MKIIYTIKEDDGSYAYDCYKQDMKYWIFEELKGLINISQEDTRAMTDDFCTDEMDTKGKKKITITARGYSHGDYQEYYVYANTKAMTEEQKGYFEDVKTGLSRIFTHQNDYFVTAKQVNSEGWEKEYEVECNVFNIDWEEFPSDALIIKTFCESEGIKQYNNIIINYNKN